MNQAKTPNSKPRNSFLMNEKLQKLAKLDQLKSLQNQLKEAELTKNVLILRIQRLERKNYELEA